MRDDEPVRRRARPVRRDAVRRHPAGPVGARHRRVDRGAHPRRRRRLVPAAATPCRRSSSRPPAGSTTSRCSTWSPRPSATGCPATRGPAPLRTGEPGADRPARPTGLIPRRDRADPPAARARPAWAGWTSAATPPPCSTPRVGGGMSSRLFQEIREKRGLVYSVGSALTALRRAPAPSRSTPGAAKKRVPEVLRLIRERAGPGGRRRAHRRGGGPRPRPAQGRPGARPRGHRLPDEPAGQERALLRRVPARARGAGPARRRRRGAGARGRRRAASAGRRAWPWSVPTASRDLDRL